MAKIATRYAGEVYPRVCGGTEANIYIPKSGKGLSPRVRGNPAAASRASGRSRSIPACAGEPTRGMAQVNRLEVYPRVCGGTNRRRHSIQPAGGLSPRVRGNQVDVENFGITAGSIPACAGEPPSRWVSTTRQKVYPRVCGGTSICGMNPPTRQGLSPRVRGNHYPGRGACLSLRSIPACAGEPRPGTLSARRCRVYPRVCGGTDTITPSWTPKSGLSPRVRGNPCRSACAAACARSIPACAGEPLIPLALELIGQVYPRVCGGTAS